MGLRFLRSLKLIPGLRLNIGKSGPSLSVGGRGLTETIGLKRTRIRARSTSGSAAQNPDFVFQRPADFYQDRFDVADLRQQG